MDHFVRSLPAVGMTEAIAMIWRKCNMINKSKILPSAFLYSNELIILISPQARERSLKLKLAHYLPSSHTSFSEI